ncbi:2-haloacid dehalogenase [Pantoea sp. PA1]|jgi:2-haloacid dehalogenase|uniref:haloacid dehalogenase type II n=1 Tax=Pantoea TaxID=53335 RepID=UPI0002417838|nr:MULTISPECIES: haloacid dehalogenase type II [Pantoea]AMB75742.1 dehalogenase [Pantoea ananatis]MCS4493243.1 haloacid dehalogenase type II [Pantoea sp. B623]MDF7789165.1 haloacid dehalogenase type II [Pantoea ananatis]MDH0051595.1 haloacid dehalogenase type II [Pantoea ananatis]MDJ0030003.1 haloacid dehalogenase type II [Pantoea ananatis]
MIYQPKFISFDCYGTLINFEMGPTAKGLFADRIAEQRMPAFLDSFRFYRLDEVLGDWKPFFQVVENAIQRACKAHDVEYRDSDALTLYKAVPTWQPHPHVVETLELISQHIPLVILSNSMVDLIPHSVAHLKAPFHAVYTAEAAQAYKPRAQIFEYMFDQLGCGPEQMMHCSSSFRYDLMTASDLGFMAKAFIDRGHEPALEGYGVDRLTDFRQLAGLLGL